MQANKFAGSGIKNENISNKELAEELHKPIIRKFKKRIVHSSFIDNTWGAYLANIQLTSKFNEAIQIFIMLLINSVNMHGLLMLYTNTFSKILDESNHKPSKIQLDKGGEFYNRSMKSWLEKNDMEICIQLITKENLLLLKDLLEPEKKTINA